MKTSASISAWSVLAPGCEPDVAFVAPLVRRRLSPLQKIYFSLAKAVESSAAAGVVFASRDGEDTLTRRLVDEFHEDGTVSPHRFSASVYNAAPGLWSVFTGNRAPYTAVAAGDDTIESALLEVLACKTPSLLVYAEETGGGYGAAVFFGDDPQSRALAVSAGDPARRAISFADLCAFLAGETRMLEGRWLTLAETSCAR